MAFMMPVVKNDWDIYNSQKPRRTSESADRAARGGGGGGGGRARKVSESRSEGPGSPAPRAALSPHRSAPAMRSLSYSRPPASRASLRPEAGSPVGSPPRADKLHNRRGASPARGCCLPYL